MPVAARCLAIGVALFSVASAVGAQPQPYVLVRFDFDGEDVETGPYTLTAYEKAKGSVSLSSAYRFNGWRSVEIRDAAGDAEFAELQGFFRELATGTVHVHFAFMLAEPSEPVNIALAGESHFRMVRDGVGFWLKARDGALVQVTGGREVRLVSLDAFRWYVTDLAYHVDDGVYDLTIRAEGIDEPIVELWRQQNAIGLPGSRIHKFSFIGDPPGVDSSNARFYVDDIVIAADRPVSGQGPFLAPARRMLFIDLYRYFQELLYERPRCPPALGPADFGFSSSDLQELAGLNQLAAFDALANNQAIGCLTALSSLSVHGSMPWR